MRASSPEHVWAHIDGLLRAQIVNLLKKIGLRMPQRRGVVCGPVGSGKTTLVLGMLGEAPFEIQVS